MSKIKKVTQGITIGLIAICALFIVGLFAGLMEKNDNQNYQIVQSLKGNMSVRSDAGWYPKWFATIKTYPKSVQAYFSSDAKEGGEEDDSIRVTFNDGGIAQVSTIVRFRMPTSDEDRLLVHREFGADMASVEASVRAHLVNCAKATATMMTASENQTSRKAEFAKVIGDQLQNGLYRFKRIEVPVLDINGQPKLTEDKTQITTFATETVKDRDGNVIIDAVSPLKQYGIEVTQFSVTSVEYDSQTRDQFAKKKDASLKAELAKIQVEQAKQETMKVVEEGKRQVASKQADMNVQIAEAEGKAAMKVAQAEQEKLEAEFLKQKAEIEASKVLEVAKLEKLASIEQAEAQKLLADAREYQLEKGGAISERDKVLAEIQKERDIGVASAWANGKNRLTPDTVVTGNSGTGGTGGLNDTLLSLKLMESMNMITPTAPVVCK